MSASLIIFSVDLFAPKSDPHREHHQLLISFNIRFSVHCPKPKPWEKNKKKSSGCQAQAYTTSSATWSFTSSSHSRTHFYFLDSLLLRDSGLPWAWHKSLQLPLLLCFLVSLLLWCYLVPSRLSLVSFWCPGLLPLFSCFILLGFFPSYQIWVSPSFAPGMFLVSSNK